MLKLKENSIVYHDDIPYASIEYFDGEIVLITTDNPINQSELLDLIDILKSIEDKF